MLPCEPTSFWRENVVAVVILQRVSARMSKWRRKISNVRSFVILRSGECVTSFNKENSQNSANVLVVVLVLESKGPYSLGRVRGRTPYDNLCGKTPLESGTFFRLQVHERVAKVFTNWSILKGREFCHFGLWNDLKRLTDSLYGCKKSRQNVLGRVVQSWVKITQG